MLYIEEEGLSPRNLSPVLLDLAKGHKSDGDIEAPPTQSQVGTFLFVFDTYVILQSPKTL